MNAIIIIGIILAILLLIWALVDVLKNKPNLWGVWILVIMLLPSVGPIIYFQQRYWINPKRKTKPKDIAAK